MNGEKIMKKIMIPLLALGVMANTSVVAGYTAHATDSLDEKVVDDSKEIKVKNTDDEKEQ